MAAAGLKAVEGGGFFFERIAAGHGDDLSSGRRALPPNI